MLPGPTALTVIRQLTTPAHSAQPRANLFVIEDLTIEGQLHIGYVVRLVCLDPNAGCSQLRAIGHREGLILVRYRGTSRDGLSVHQDGVPELADPDFKDVRFMTQPDGEGSPVSAGLNEIYRPSWRAWRVPENTAELNPFTALERRAGFSIAVGGPQVRGRGKFDSARVVHPSRVQPRLHLLDGGQRHLSAELSVAQKRTLHLGRNLRQLYHPG